MMLVLGEEEMEDIQLATKALEGVVTAMPLVKMVALVEVVEVVVIDLITHRMLEVEEVV
jgi:hypothetical protein